MFFVLFLLICTILYFGLFHFLYYPQWYFSFIWAGASVLAAVLTLVIYLLIMIFIFRFISPKSKYRHFMLYHVTWFVKIVHRLDITVINKENIVNDTFVAFPNHKSKMDIIIIYYVYHKVMSAAAKAQLFDVIFLSSVMKSTAAIKIDRSNDRESLRAISKGIKDVEGGLSMMIFPEGGVRSRETELMVDVKPGAYKLATKAGAVIQPVSILGTSIIINTKWYVKKKIKVIIHKPIYKEEYDLMSTKELGDKVFEIVNSGITNAKD